MATRQEAAMETMETTEDRVNAKIHALATELSRMAGTQEDAMDTTRTQCKAGHGVEAGKAVSGQGWCNLCLRDLQRGKPAGTTARERGLYATREG